MRRGTIVLVIFLAIAAGVVGLSQFLQNQPPLQITVAVNPLAEDWVRSAASDFNASEPRINGTRRVEVDVITISDLDVWGSGRSSFWTADDHPDAWIPAASASVEYAIRGNLPFETVTESTAQTPLVWGGFAERVDIITTDNALDWDTVQNAAETESWSALGGRSSWQFVNLAFLLPDRTMTGLATLFSAAADFNDTAALTGDDTRGSDFYNWLEPVIDSVPNFNSVGDDVAVFAARGPNTVDIAIGPEVQWLNGLNGMLRNGEVRFAYPEYIYLFDFPIARWEDAATSDDIRSAVDAFADYLTNDAQNEVADYGLRPLNGAPAQTDTLFADAVQYGIQLNPTFDNVITAPSVTDAQGLIQWFTTAQRR